MQMVMQYLANPFIAAAVIGGGVFVGLEIMRPGFLDDIPLASNFNLGMIAAIAYIMYTWFMGKMSLPVLGRYAKAGMMARHAPSSMQKAMTTSMSDLLGPDAF